MTDTTVSAALTAEQWDKAFYREYLEANRFKREMGTSSNNIIQLNSDLTKKRGEAITFALAAALTGAGKTGSAVLEGEEEAMDTYGFRLAIDKIRNAVRVAEIDEQYSAISLRQAGREVLMDWIMERCRDDIIEALGSIDGIAYGTATAGQRNTWLTNNADRVLFGDEIVNGASNVHATALGLIASTETFSAANLQLMKRIASTASPKIRPVRTTEDERMFVAYCDSRTFRDIKADAVITAAQREALSRGQSNPLFSGGDILYDGVVVKEIPDIASLGAVGAASAAVSPVYLCGAQAVGFAWGKKTKSIVEVFDYQDKHGVAIEEIRGIGKMRFNDKDHGVVTGYFAAAADA